MRDQSARSQGSVPPHYFFAQLQHELEVSGRLVVPSCSFDGREGKAGESKPPIAIPERLLDAGGARSGSLVMENVCRPKPAVGELDLKPIRNGRNGLLCANR